MNKVELLAPAGNLEKAKIAILYGANAVYIGGKSFSLRSRASNFTLEEMKELVEFAKEHNAHVHVTVNMLPHEQDLDGLKEYLLALDEVGIHAIIVASPAIMTLAKSLNPNYEVHVSTQHSSTNSAAVAYWQQQGMDRVVLARECTLENIQQIASKSSLPLEVFIHGGMCISYSGRCVLSNHMTLRDANRGGCAQSCRWKYHLMDQDKEVSHPDSLFSMSSKDLQALEMIEPLLKAGIASFKIEGRMKSAYYLATVVSAYRRCIDTIYEKGTITKEELEACQKEIAKAENRQTGPGFYKGIPGYDVQLYQDHDETVTQEFVAEILEVKESVAKVVVRNKFSINDSLEIFGPHIKSTEISLKSVYDEEGQNLEICNKPMQIVYMEFDGDKEDHAMIRKRRF